MENKYTTLLFDFDDTLFDFNKSSRFALSETFKQFGIDFDDNCMGLFNRINDVVWKAFERGEYSKKEILILRFDMMFNELKIDNVDSFLFNAAYLEKMCVAVFPFDGAFELCEKLCGKFDMYIITNSVERVNKSRMKASGIDKYFLDSFISERIGWAKPNAAYFDYVMDNIREKDRSKVLIIGDSLTSDIQGGINAGIDTCWLNWGGMPCSGINPTYTARGYADIEQLLGV